MLTNISKQPVSPNGVIKNPFGHKQQSAKEFQLEPASLLFVLKHLDRKQRPQRSLIKFKSN